MNLTPFQSNLKQPLKVLKCHGDESIIKNPETDLMIPESETNQETLCKQVVHPTACPALVIQLAIGSLTAPLWAFC